jgi:hypothetical protein
MATEVKVFPTAPCVLPPRWLALPFTYTNDASKEIKSESSKLWSEVSSPLWWMLFDFLNGYDIAQSLSCVSRTFAIATGSPIASSVTPSLASSMCNHRWQKSFHHRWHFEAIDLLRTAAGLPATALPKLLLSNNDRNNKEEANRDVSVTSSPTSTKMSQLTFTASAPINDWKMEYARSHQLQKIDNQLRQWDDDKRSRSCYSVALVPNSSASKPYRQIIRDHRKTYQSINNNVAIRLMDLKWKLNCHVDLVVLMINS